jgi:uncharacterized membrane protein
MILIASIFGLVFSILISIPFLGEIDLLTNSIILSIRPGLLFSLVAFLSGIAAAFSFAKPHLNISLSGVAIAVALVPPLGATGIGIAMLDYTLAVNSFAQYGINLAMIILANFLIFKVMEFDTRESTAEIAFEKTEEEVKEEEEYAKKKIADKEENRDNQ